MYCYRNTTEKPECTQINGFKDRSRSSRGVRTFCTALQFQGKPFIWLTHQIHNMADSGQDYDFHQSKSIRQNFKERNIANIYSQIASKQANTDSQQTDRGLVSLTPLSTAQRRTKTTGQKKNLCTQVYNSINHRIAYA